MKRKEKELGYAAEAGDFAAVRRLLREGANPKNFEYVSSHRHQMMYICSKSLIFIAAH